LRLNADKILTEILLGPWCQIGHKALEDFLQSSEFQTQIGHKVTPKLKLQPYILDSRLPATDYDVPEGIYDRRDTTPYKEHEPPTKKSYYSGKFMGQLDAFDAKISKRATELGLPKYNWLTEGKVGATWCVTSSFSPVLLLSNFLLQHFRDCHRLIYLAGEKDEASPSAPSTDGKYQPGIQAGLVEQLYRDFHHGSQDLSERPYLIKTAVAHKLFGSEDEAKKWLESDAVEYELKNKLKVADMLGVQSIPFIVLQDGADHMSEVGDHDSFMRMFKMVASPYL
jgi:predicted DsbA family dithiol-disulfide isomerase